MKYQTTLTTAVLDEKGLALQDGWILCYLTNPQTGEFTKAEMEWVMKGVGLPSGAYTDEPVFDVIPEDKALVRVLINPETKQSEWALVDDFRGEKSYVKATQEEIEIKEIGSLPKELTLKQPQSKFDKWDESLGEWIEDSEALIADKINSYSRYKTKLLAQANDLITPLERAERLGIITHEETERLERLEIYTVDLSRIVIDEKAIEIPMEELFPKAPE